MIHVCCILYIYQSIIHSETFVYVYRHQLVAIWEQSNPSDGLALLQATCNVNDLKRNLDDDDVNQVHCQIMQSQVRIQTQTQIYM